MRRALTHVFTLLILTYGVVPVAAQAPVDRLSESVREFVSVDAPVVALVGVRVVDGTGAEPADDQTVLIRNGLIETVGAAAEVAVPDEAEVLELAGHTVIPGLVGMHNHTFYTTSTRRAQVSTSASRLYLASGVTTIRTTGSYQPYAEVNMKRAIEEGLDVGPRMHVAGPYLTGPGGGYMTSVETAEEARRVVGYWAEEGATWFKAYTRISREALGAAIEEAHRRGLKFTGHICSVSFTEAVELGIDNIEHGFFTNTDWFPEKQPDECTPGFRNHLATVEIDSPEVQETIRTMVDNGVAMTSTLAVYELIVPGRPPLEDRVIEMLSPEMAEEYLATREAIAENADESIWPTLFEKAQAFEKAFHDAGGLLGAGVDPTGIGGALPGFGDQRNFELLIEAGFTPVEVIQIMSLNGARILEVDDEIGSVEAGKLADLVVIDGDPVARPAEIRNVTIVFKDGVGYDPEKLLASVRGRVGVL